MLGWCDGLQRSTILLGKGTRSPPQEAWDFFKLRKYLMGNIDKKSPAENVQYLLHAILCSAVGSSILISECCSWSANLRLPLLLEWLATVVPSMLVPGFRNHLPPMENSR
jgi:hypothetical protein